MNQSLIKKYDVAAPRYTSYPTVPHWKESTIPAAAWLQRLKSAFSKDEAISLYIHLPFCERLCTYCGCNKRITRNHSVEHPYIEALLQEWKIYHTMLGKPPVLRSLHLGGGTPTFFQAQNLRRLLASILEDVIVPEQRDYSFEAHPSTCDQEHIQTLADLGFNRISIGVQDFGADVMAVINRKQTYEDVARVTQQARYAGFGSINYDLIYGLPLQTPAHIDRTLEHIRTTAR